MANISAKTAAVDRIWLLFNSVLFFFFFFKFPSIILKVSGTTGVGRRVRMVPLVAREMGNVDPVALVSGSRAVAGGDSGGIDAFVSGSKVMSPAAVSCV